jgi:hypothetical protein
MKKSPTSPRETPSNSQTTQNPTRPPKIFTILKFTNNFNIPKMTKKSTTEPILTILAILFTLTATFAQQDTSKPAPQPVMPPLVSPIVGYVNFGMYTVYDSLNKPVLKYPAKVPDTLSVVWGVNLIPCDQCVGGMLFVRTLHLKAPGIDQYIQAVPTDNTEPAFDEAWQTTIGNLYLSLDATGRPTQFLVKQPNKYSLRWSSPISLPEKPK